MENYIDDKKKLYSAILNFLESSNERNEEESEDMYFQELISIVKSQEIEGNKREMQQFLQIIQKIGENHHRDLYFDQKINQILEHYSEQIKQTLTSIEIFHIFERNKNMILFLLKKGIIRITDQIYSEIMVKGKKNGISYWHFFVPEIENFIGEEKIKSDKEELLNKHPNLFENYEENRQEGENDSYICSLIRQDSVEEFISYINRQNISHSSLINHSIFETNSFLIDEENVTLIEYSAFFGSIQIFQYLMMNKVELTPSLWLYAIHSKSAELIHLLESNEVPPPKDFNDEENEKEEEENLFSLLKKLIEKLHNGEEEELDENDDDKKHNSDKNYVRCFIESIKCHHNDIADYIESNLLNENDQISAKEKIISNSIKYFNYNYFEIKSINCYGFANLYIYHYDKLVDFLLKMKEKEIEMKII